MPSTSTRKTTIVYSGAVDGTQELEAAINTQSPAVVELKELASGANTMYEDSVSGASSIGWSSGVPPYSTMSSSQIATILGGRGYVW